MFIEISKAFSFSFSFSRGQMEMELAAKKAPHKWNKNNNGTKPGQPAAVKVN